jgi:hypothetical protein
MRPWSLYGEINRTNTLPTWVIWSVMRRKPHRDGDRAKSIQIDPFEHDPNGAYHDPNGVDEQTLEWNNYSGSSPSEGYTAYLWPPSIHEAAQYIYQAAPPARQPVNVRFEDLMITAEEPWQIPHAAPRSYRERERNNELLQANRLPPAYGGHPFSAGDPDVVPPTINLLNDHEYDSPQTVK